MVKVLLIVVLLVIVVTVVAVTVVVVRALVRAETVIGPFVAVLTVDVLIIVSGMAVDLLLDALTDITRGVRTNMGVDMLADVNATVLALLMTVFEFDMPDPLEEFGC